MPRRSGVPLAVVHAPFGTGRGLEHAGSEAKRRLRFLGTTVEQILLGLANLRLRDALRDQSIRDPLTGLFNRRYIEESLEQEIARATRSATPVSLLILDLDHFKNMNDTCGRSAGDRLLRELRALLSFRSRTEDVAARYDGEEFLLMPAGHGQNCGRAARRGIAHRDWRHSTRRCRHRIAASHGFHWSGGIS